MSRAYWNDSDMGLTRGEYKIVHLLVSNVGRYVTYRAIYDRLHYEGFIAGSGDDGYRGNVRSADYSFRPWAHSSMDCLMQQHPSQKLLDFSIGIRLGKKSSVFRCFTKRLLGGRTQDNSGIEPALPDPPRQRETIHFAWDACIREHYVYRDGVQHRDCLGRIRCFKHFKSKLAQIRCGDQSQKYVIFNNQHDRQLLLMHAFPTLCHSPKRA
jgi:hypothetical protein